MKKSLIIFAFFAVCALYCENLAAQTSTPPLGSGTLADPYQISSLNNLYWLTQTTAAWASGKYFIQTADIDASSTNTWASGAGFSPIGNGTTTFQGNYDGNSKKITSLYINRSGTQYIAMFGYVAAGYIKNLTLETPSVTVSSSGFGNGTGILAGMVYNATVSNVIISGGSITVTGTGQEIGTIAGSLQGSSGIIEYCRSSATVSNTHTSATTAFTGGFIGYRTAGTIRYCSATGNVTANGWRVGGFVGEMSGTGSYIYQCFASGNVTGGGSGTGGFVGNIYQITISDCFAMGDISGSGSSYGGFFGHAQSSPVFIRCYAKGKLNPSSWAGGFGGYSEATSFTNCFWDVTTSTKSGAMGYGTYGTTTGKTTAQMKTQSTFTNWDFNTVWNIDASINSGYPFLRLSPYDQNANTWTGAVNTDWNTAGNWSKNSVPLSTENVVIPNVSNKPVISNGNTGNVNNITIHTGSSVTVNGTFDIKGSVTNSGTLTTSSGTVSFSGSSTQSTSGLSGTYSNLTINNANGVSLSNHSSVTGTISFSYGKITLGNYNLTSNGSISGASASNYVVTGGTGALKRNISHTGSFTFPVGNSVYNPVTVTNNSGSADDFSVTVSDAVYNNGTSGTPYSTNCVNRSWNISKTAANGGSGIDITFQWSAADELTGFTRNNLCISHYENNGWFYKSGSLSASGSDPYTITLTGYTGSFSPFAVANYNGPLPVALESFTSTIFNRDVRLNWRTASESGNTGFDIERKNPSGGWNKIGFVPGMGNSNTAVSYTFEDKKLNAGNYSYRLKQKDNNGNFEYYNLAGSVVIALPGKSDLSQNYPNPFNPATNIDFQIPSDTKISLSVYDVTGKLIRTIINNESRKADFYTVKFEGGGLPSGIYFYKLTAEGFSVTKKMILIK